MTRPSVARSAGKVPAQRKGFRPARPERQPKDPAAQAARLYDQGKPREALHVASEALRREPVNARLWDVGAAAAFALGLFADAERFWTVAIRHDPNSADAHSNLGTLYARTGELAAAERCFIRAIALDPRHASALSNLGALRVDQQRYAQALPPLEASLAIAGERPDALNNLGLALFHLDRVDEAREALRRAAMLKPDFPDLLVNTALIHMHDGDEPAAERAFDAVLALEPGHARALLFKSEQNRAMPDCAWVGPLEEAYRRRAGRLVPEVIHLDFAMGKVCEELARYDEAFAAYAEGNRLHHGQHPFDEHSEQRYLDIVRTGFGADVYGEAALAPPDTVSTDKVPIFIVGMPRSGTTLMEQILAAHPEVAGAGELSLLGELLAPVPPEVPPPGARGAWLSRLRELGNRYLEDTWKAHPGATFLVDKMPGNHRFAGLIPLMIPQARIIHMNRAPLDVCWSCFTQLFATGHEYAYDQGTLGRQYVRYHRLMEHWRAVMPPGRLLEVHYEDVVADLERETRRVLAHLGLDWHERCARFYERRQVVRTASRTQVRRPLYASSVGRWKSFAKHLAPLIQALEPIHPAP